MKRGCGYGKRPVYLSDDERTEEADKVSSRIAEILSETAFSFSPNEYISIHRKLFRGIYKHAGKIRDYNITKKEFECVKTSFKFSIGGYY